MNRKATLLIDWENFVAKISAAPYWIKDPAPEVVKLVEAVQDHAAGQDATLTQKHYFHGAKTDLGLTRGDLQNLGFRVGIGTEAKNAADTLLIVEATRQQALAGFEVFYVVTGDEDFADLAHALEAEGGSCFLCPTDRSRLRGPIKVWHRKLFVDKAAADATTPGLIELPRNTPPSASEIDQLVMCLQGMADSGRHLGNWNVVVGALARDYGVFGTTDSVRTLMQKADADNLLVMQDIEVRGRRERHRRLRYEDARLMRLFGAADLVLEEARRKNGAATRGDLLNVVSSEAQSQFPALPEMLRVAGYLHTVGESFSLDSARGDYGILRALRRVALTVWHAEKNSQSPGVDAHKIYERWVRHKFPGQRDLSRDKIDQALNEGRRMVDRARAAGVIEFAAQGHNRYSVREDHPLVEQAVSVAKFVWGRIPKEPATLSRDQLLADIQGATVKLPAFGATARDHREWLGALASSGIIHLRQGQAARARNTNLHVLWP